MTEHHRLVFTLCPSEVHASLCLAIKRQYGESLQVCEAFFRRAVTSMYLDNECKWILSTIIKTMDISLTTSMSRCLLWLPKKPETRNRYTFIIRYNVLLGSTLQDLDLCPFWSCLDWARSSRYPRTKVGDTMAAKFSIVQTLKDIHMT